MKLIKKYKSYIFVVLLTLVIIGFIFGMQNVYPFGKNIFSVLDFESAYTPVYYKWWDVLHGSGTVLFDWNLGGGLNCYGSLIMNSLLYPSSLVIFFFKRSFIPYAMSYILILKLLKISLITYYVINKLFKKVNDNYKIMFTLMYTYSGWMMFMISNILYLDVIALFPLFVLAYYRLLKDNKWLLYVVILTMCLLSSFYMSWMILFFIIGAGTLSMLILDIKDKKKKAVKILLLTLISLGASCILFLPAAQQSLSSFRIATSETIKDSYVQTLMMKVLHLVPLSIPIFLTIKQLLVKKDKKLNIFIGSLLLYLLIGVVVEPINEMWHTGSYWSMPFRYSYIPTFVLILVSLYYLENNYKNKNKDSLVNTISALLIVGLFILFTFLLKDSILVGQLVYRVDTYGQFVGLMFLFLLGLILTFLSFKLDKKNNIIVLMIFVLIQSCVFGYLIIRNNDTEYLSTISSVKTQELKDNFEIKTDGFNYVNYLDYISMNGAYILQAPTMENRLHIVKGEEVLFSDALGYRVNGTTINSTGGSLFTNLLMQNKYYFNSKEMDSKYYNLLEEHDGIKLYERKYNLNYILPYNGKEFNSDNGSVIDNQNTIYRDLFDRENDIVHRIDYTERGVNYVYNVTKGNMYYIYIHPKMYEEIAVNFAVNQVDIDQVFFKDNNDLTIIFSTKEDKEITLNKDRYMIESIEAGYISYDEVIDFVKDYGNYEVSYKIDKNKKTYYFNNDTEYNDVLIPVNYDEALKVKVNGKEVDYKLNVFNMISVPVNKGDNTIEISYVAKYLKEGIVISIVSILLIIIVYFSDKKLKYLDKKYILYFLYVITLLIVVLFLLKVYVMSWL